MPPFKGLPGLPALWIISNFLPSLQSSFFGESGGKSVGSSASKNLRVLEATMNPANFMLV